MARLKTLSEAVSHLKFLLKVSESWKLDLIMKILVFACDKHSDLKSFILSVGTVQTMDLEYVGSC